MDVVEIGARKLAIHTRSSVSDGSAYLSVLPMIQKVLQRVEAAYNYIADAIWTGHPIYGVTTGFGGIANKTILPEQAQPTCRPIFSGFSRQALAVTCRQVLYELPCYCGRTASCKVLLEPAWSSSSDLSPS